MSILEKLNPYATYLKLALLTAVFLLGSWAGCSVQKGIDAEEVSAMSRALNKVKADAAEEKRKAAETQLADKKKADEDLEALRVKSLKDKQDAKKDYDATIAKLRNGSIVVRPHLTCPAVPSSGTTAEGEGGLQREDAEFLLRESERADELVRKYNDAIDLLDTIYKSRK